MIKMKNKIIITFSLISICMVLLAVNLFNISVGSSSEVYSNSGDIVDSITLSHLRGSIYDRNLIPLAGRGYSNGVLVDPLLLDEKSEKALSDSADNITTEELKEKINDGNLFYVNTTEAISGSGLLAIANNQRYSKPFLAQNLLGYISEDKGVCGVEEAFDQLLYFDESYSVKFRPDAAGHILDGLGFSISGTADGIKSGVVLTIDSKIQEICESVADDMLEKGAIVVMETNTGYIVADVSRPTYNPERIEDYLNVDGAFLNKATEEYCCGSAFKIVVTAAALESNLSVSYDYCCPGKYSVGNTDIGCGNVHGDESLKSAFANSCNSYFCNLASQVGGDRIRSMAIKMGLGSCNDLGGIYGKSGNVPSVDELDNSIALANFSIGQGSLTVTPIQICAMTNVIANKGYYITPKVVLGTTDNGENINSMVKPIKQQIISVSTADKIKKLMINTTEQGTGVLAMPCLYGAGTKTSTAETGIYENGKEIYHTWVTGFVPADTPKYTITVLVEGGESGYASASPIMAKIADGMIAAGLYS